ncbi:MAG: aspartate 1-decarboxylase [Candidatus Omnitrophica bacterium]|nr:aspartate 1-decarboxylase [Candidatus Omnitrophota bacterium]
MCKSKISNGVVTGKELYYQGSIKIDMDIIEKSGMVPGEMVDVLNVNNGARITTYIIPGESGSGEISLNGPASRFFEIGDNIIVLSSCIIDEKEAKDWKKKSIRLKDNNKTIELVE